MTWEFDEKRYAGHTPGPWIERLFVDGSLSRLVGKDDCGDVLRPGCWDGSPWFDCDRRADLDLIIDAPMLLAEVIRLRKELGK